MKNLRYKIIKNLEQYNEYCDIHAELMTTEEAMDEIELLELLIEDYDRRIMADKLEELNAVELLRSLLINAEWSQSKFAEQIGVSRQLINDILAYRRNISKELVVKFADFFSMSQEAFSRSYELKTNKNTAAYTFTFSNQVPVVNEPKPIPVEKKNTVTEKPTDD